MKSISKVSKLPMEGLSKIVRCAVDVQPKGNDGFVAEFHLRNCCYIPQLKVAENPKLFWYSPSRRITPCNLSGGNPYGSRYITSAISRYLGDYTTILGRVTVLQNTGDIWFETTDPREADYMLLLPLLASEWVSNTWEEAEVQRHSLMYATNDDTMWGSKRYILLNIGYYYTEKGETPDYEAQAKYYRKLAVAELLLTGQCSEELANEYFPGLTRDKVVNGRLLAKAYGARAIGSINAAKRYYALDENGNIIPTTMHRDYADGSTDLLWLELPGNALVLSCNKFEVCPIYGSMGDATEKQRQKLSEIIQEWPTPTVI